MIRIITVIFLVAVNLIIYSCTSDRLMVTNYKLEFSYMAYACGDCYAQYKVNRILRPEKNELKDLVGTDIKVIFKEDKLEKRIDSLTGKCAICYNYYFVGTLTKKRNNSYYILSADSCNFSLRDSTCCDIR